MLKCRQLEVALLDVDSWRWGLQYSFHGVPMSQKCWHAIHGDPCFRGWGAIQRRSAGYEAAIRAGEGEPANKAPINLRQAAAGSRTHVAKRWMHNYFEDHCERTPTCDEADGITAKAHYPKRRPGYHYERYCKQVPEGERLKVSHFNHCWRQAVKAGWRDPTDGTVYELVERKGRAKGFKACTICESNDEKLQSRCEEVSKAERASIRQQQREHWTLVGETRDVYAANKLRGLTNPKVLSAACDAAAQEGHRLPLTRSRLPSVVSMDKLQLKIVGFLQHGKGYNAFVTMPWVRTGANLTATVLMEMIASGHFCGKEELLLQIDGGSDNVAYTFLYFCAYLLWHSYHGDMDGLDLIRIVLSRLEVGHTHIDIDQVFSVLSKWLFGTKDSGVPTRDVHAFEEFCDAIRAGTIAAPVTWPRTPPMSMQPRYSITTSAPASFGTPNTEGIVPATLRWDRQRERERERRETQLTTLARS